MSTQGWIGVDLDGTLAHYDEWKGPEHIGEPIPAMVDRVKAWLDAGIEVRIFTARIWPFTGVLRPNCAMPVPEGDQGRQSFLSSCAIAQWSREHLGQILPITCVKDFAMRELWDDRAVQVERNTGRRIGLPEL